ncbi:MULTISPECIES: DUF2000 family protein [Streptomyces]|uniref:DUF2000 family protein n=1 Tax=Streptomyces TaxID=1883 RepID=UPI0004BDB8B3|nr:MULTISPECIES: DUF2000 family protein [Streptomyces]KOG67169.1 hypothetical protein ADK77_16555 [Streptomyces antibioticus]
MTIYVATSTPVGERPYRRRGPLPVEHMVIAVHEELGPEERVNAAAVVSLAAGARMSGVRGLDLPDTGPWAHAGTLRSRVAVLPTSQAGLVALRAAAVRGELGICECPGYGDPARAVRSTHARDPQYAALAVFGRRESVEGVLRALTASGSAPPPSAPPVT